MNDSTSKPSASPVEAAVPLPDCSRVTSDVTPIRSAKSRLSFSSSLGCTDWTSSVSECNERQGGQAGAQPVNSLPTTTEFTYNRANRQQPVFVWREPRPTRRQLLGVAHAW